MNTLFIFLFLVSLIVLVVGLSKPEKIKLTSRKEVWLKCGTTVIVLFIFIGLTTPTDKPTAPITTASDTSAPVQSQQVSNTPVTVKSVASKKDPVATAPATPKTYQQVFTFSGDGSKKSEPFTITGSRFKIKYDCPGRLCSASLYKTNGDMTDLIMNAKGPLTDETIIYGSGEYYIDSNSIGNYTMTVEDYK
jgi:hypothetical protein